MGRMTQASREYYGFDGELSIRVGIEYGQISFYETPEPPNNITIFATFEEAKTAAAIIYEEYKKKTMSELEENEKILPTLTEDNVLGYNPDGGW